MSISSAKSVEIPPPCILYSCAPLYLKLKCDHLGIICCFGKICQPKRAIMNFNMSEGFYKLCMALVFCPIVGQVGKCFLTCYILYILRPHNYLRLAHRTVLLISFLWEDTIPSCLLYSSSGSFSLNFWVFLCLPPMNKFTYLKLCSICRKKESLFWLLWDELALVFLQASNGIPLKKLSRVLVITFEYTKYSILLNTAFILSQR